MTKINKEEYKFLKSLDDKWKWIARNYNGALITYTDKPMKNPNLYWDSFGERMDDRLFQFIQWEDEEPYNIAELIEEYENKEFYDYVGWKYAESEETEVNKDIQWLKKEIHKELEDWHGVEGGIDGDGINEIMLLINQHEESEVKRLERKIKELDSYNDELIRDNNQFRNELDNQEVLSQEWIDKYKVDYDNWMPAVPIVHLQNLLVPKRHKEETNTLHDGEIRLQIGFDGSTETSYATSVGEALEILTDYDSSYHVIEKPTVPQFVADWHVQNKYYLLGAKFERIADWEDKRVVDWYRHCSGRHNNNISNAQETIALMDLVGYEVEEEQKYYLKIGNLYLAEPLGDMTSDIVKMTRDKGVAYQFTDEKSIATHLDKFEGTEAVKVEELEE